MASRQEDLQRVRVFAALADKVRASQIQRLEVTDTDCGFACRRPDSLEYSAVCITALRALLPLARRLKLIRYVLIHYASRFSLLIFLESISNDMSLAPTSLHMYFSHTSCMWTCLDVVPTSVHNDCSDLLSEQT